jgi:hypothetical protein
LPFPSAITERGGILPGESHGAPQIPGSPTTRQPSESLRRSIPLY